MKIFTSSKLKFLAALINKNAIKTVRGSQILGDIRGGIFCGIFGTEDGIFGQNVLATLEAIKKMHPATVTVIKISWK